LAKNCQFFLPLFHSAPSLPMFALEFRDEVNREETIESWGYPPKDSHSHNHSLSHIDTVAECDGQTDRRTDGFTVASTALCIASYADAL